MARRDNALADTNKTQVGSRVYQAGFAGMTRAQSHSPGWRVSSFNVEPNRRLVHLEISW